MNYKDTPFVVKSIPSNLAEDVPTTTEIVLQFNTALDRRTLESSLVVTGRDGAKVAGHLSYRDEKLTFKATMPFAPGEQYTVTVLSPVSTSANGVRSVLGLAMPQNWVITFVTIATGTLLPPALLTPGNQTTVSYLTAELTGEAPEPLQFTWEDMAGATRYEIQLASDPNMGPEATVWQTALTGTGPTRPSTSVPDGFYYWRVRAYDENDLPGAWSSIGTFALDGMLRASIAPEDLYVPDIASGQYLGEDTPLYEVVSVTLAAGESLTNGTTEVSVDVDYIEVIIRPSVDLDVDQIPDTALRLTGRPLAGEVFGGSSPTVPAHGVVAGDLTKTKNSDGTITLRLTLPTLAKSPSPPQV